MIVEYVVYLIAYVRTMSMILIETLLLSIYLKPFSAFDVTYHAYNHIIDLFIYSRMKNIDERPVANINNNNMIIWII